MVTENDLDQALIDELTASVLSLDLDPKTEVCATMLRDRTGKALSTCERILKTEEEAGTMTSREARYKGRRVLAYRRAI